MQEYIVKGIIFKFISIGLGLKKDLELQTQNVQIFILGIQNQKKKKTIKFSNPAPILLQKKKNCS